MNGTNRLGLLRPDELGEDGKKFYDILKSYTDGKYKNIAQYRLNDGRFIGPFAVQLHTPVIGEAWFHFDEAINAVAANLPRKAREVAINAVSAHSKAAYEFYAHQNLALIAGVTEQQLAIIAEGNKPDDLTEQEDVAWRVAHELCARPSGGPLSEGTWERAVQLLGKQSAIGLVHLVGFYQYVSSILNGFDARMPDGKHWDPVEGKWTV